MAEMSTNTEKVYVESIITLVIDTGIDLTSATGVFIDVKFPTGHTPTTDRWTGEVFEVTKIKYTTSETDLDVTGKYLLQAIYPSVTPLGDVPGDTCVLTVIDRFK